MLRAITNCCAQTQLPAALGRAGSPARRPTVFYALARLRAAAELDGNRAQSVAWRWCCKFCPTRWRARPRRGDDRIRRSDRSTIRRQNDHADRASRWPPRPMAGFESPRCGRLEERRFSTRFQLEQCDIDHQAVPGAGPLHGSARYGIRPSRRNFCGDRVTQRPRSGRQRVGQNLQHHRHATDCAAVPGQFQQQP